MDSFLFSFILGLVCVSLGNAEDNLVKLQVIFRHGYRYPINLGWTKNDTCATTYDSEKLGNLTNLGKSQMSLLGYFLRIHYNSFIGPYSNETQVYYSDCHRDWESARLVQEALFKNFDNKMELKLEMLNKTIEGEGAINDTAYSSWVESLPWKDNLRELCKTLNKTDGMTCRNRNEFQNIVEQMVSEQAEGCVLPPWLTPDVMKDLQSDYNALYESFELCTSKDMIQQNSDLMLKWMNEAFKQENSGSNKKVHLYASHDTNIAIILTRMGVFNSMPVPFGAAVAFEQHMIQNKPIIRLFYDNSTDYSNFQKLKLPGCDWDCPYEKFVEIVTGSYDCNFAARPEALGLVTILSFMVFHLLH